MTPAATGALLGLAAGGALLYSASRTPWLRRVRLEDRLAPYLRDTSRAAAGPTLPVAGGAVGALVAPLLSDVAIRLDVFLGGRAALARRLQRAGGRFGVEEFRARQVVAAVLGGLVGAVLLAVRLGLGVGPAPVVDAALVVFGAVGGVVAADAWLSQAVRTREAAIVAEFPAVAELMALAVGAGESPLGALERVTRASGGELSVELRRALADVRAGAPLVRALDGIADRTAVASVARFVDGMAIALERGTPLADVLRAQASDVREAAKQALLEAGGRKEIAMMIPVVFVVLPVTVLFAAYPALVSLTFTG